MSESDYSLEQQSNSQVKRPYNRVTSQQKQELFKEVFENRMKITKAARKLGLNLSTAKFLIKKYKRENQLLRRNKQSCTSNTPTPTPPEPQLLPTLTPPTVTQTYPILYYYAPIHPTVYPYSEAASIFPYCYSAE